MASAELVLLAIRAVFKLGHQARQAYMQSVQGRLVVLPLPSTFNEPTLATVKLYFVAKGGRHVASGTPLKELLDRAEAGPLDPPGEAALWGHYHECVALDQAEEPGGPGTVSFTDGSSVDVESWKALMTVRQWGRAEEERRRKKMLFAVIGTVIDVGVDYAATVPGALNTKSRQGRVLAGFVEALDKVDLADGQWDQKSLGDLAARFCVAALETLGEKSEALSSDKNVQELIRVTTHGLAQDVVQGLGGLKGNAVKQERLRDWSELVFRSVLNTAGRKVISDPRRFLGVEGTGEGALVTQVGGAVLSLALDDDHGLRLDRLLGRQGVETLIDAALNTVGDHPELFGEDVNAGVKALLTGTAKALGDTAGDRLTPQILPELARILLSNTSANAALIWPGLEKKPETHLLLTAARTALAALTAKPAGGAKWRAEFGRAEILLVAEAVVTEVAANPGWLVKGAARINDDLGPALAAVLAVLRERGGDWLTPATAAEVLRAAVQAVMLRQEFVRKLSNGRVLVAAAVEAVLASIAGAPADSDAGWQLLRDEAITTAVEVVLEQLSKAKLNLDEDVIRVAKVLSATVASLNEGGGLDWVALESSLEAELSRAA
jgi:hypothetical protein